jgi:hypothetical protein
MIFWNSQIIGDRMIGKKNYSKANFFCLLKSRKRKQKKASNNIWMHLLNQRLVKVAKSFINHS